MYPQENYPNIAPPLALPSERADLLDKIQPTLIVDDLFHMLMGEIRINGNWVKDPELSNTALTKRGAWEITTLMTPVSSQNVSLSKLKDDEIRTRALSIAKAVQIKLLTNWREYGIHSREQFRSVHEIVFSNTFITLKQPEGEGIRRLLKDTMTAEISDPYPTEQQQGGGGLLGLFRKRK